MSATATNTNPSALYLTAGQVQARYGGVSHMWLLRKQQSEGFPAPVRFGAGRLRFWRIADLDRWDAAAIESGAK